MAAFFSMLSSYLTLYQESEELYLSIALIQLYNSYMLFTYCVWVLFSSSAKWS